MAAKPHLLIVEARFYDDISDALFEGARMALEQAGATWERVSVPGALEIPYAIRMAVEASDEETLKRPFDGYVALGCVIRGETAHYDIVARESAAGLYMLAVEHGVPIGNGILTCETGDQAWERASVARRNKGCDAARACITLMQLEKNFSQASRR